MITEFELGVIQTLQSFSSPILNGLMNITTFMGDPLFWIFVAAAIYWAGEHRGSFMLMNLVLFASAIAGLLKISIQRPRPEEFGIPVLEHFRSGYSMVSNFSFPSGHATLVGSVFGYFHTIVKEKEVWILAVIAVLVSISRIYLGVHFLSDIIVGLIIGYFIGKFNNYLEVKFRKSRFQLTILKEELILVLLLFVALIGIVFFTDVPLIGMVVGFYAGFFLFREMLPETSPLKGRSLFFSETMGFFVLLLILGPAAVFFDSIEHALVFIFFTVGGLWISFIHPYLFETILRDSLDKEGY